jgi:hypothetical protein
MAVSLTEFNQSNSLQNRHHRPRPNHHPHLHHPIKHNSGLLLARNLGTNAFEDQKSQRNSVFGK